MANLTAQEVKHARPGKHGDGDGLCLVVSGTGAKKWVLRVQVDGRRRDIGLGSLKNVTLAEARDAADDMRRAFRRGEDPVAAREKAKGVPTFRKVAGMVHKEHRPSWKNAKHAAQWLSTLEDYAFPDLGDRPVHKITGPMVRDTLAKIWLVKPETARRVRQRIGTVLDFAHAKGWRDSEAPMRSVTRGLPKQPKVKQHFAAMHWQDVPAFVAGMPEKLKAGESALLAVEFIILTATRSGEARGARWSEFDWAEKVWSIPASRMKSGRAHRVPLSYRAVAILTRMQELRSDKRDTALVFEGQKRGRPLSDMTLTMAFRRAGITATVHGFRSAFRDWAAERTGFPRELAEKALAHVVRDKVEAAYQRGDLFDKRRKLMDAWAAYCESGRAAAGNVVALRSA